ncbi:MAG: four helix bundle protein [Ignavibacteriae bacterium]|nr:four helix bundle protein [Ignavibacteriota bacterium]
MENRGFSRAHCNLEAWKKGIELSEAVYAATRRFPDDERFGLTSQMRRAAVSIPTNIAEGAARSGPREYAHYLYIARGSLSELETLIHISTQLGLLPSSSVLAAKMSEVSRSLSGLITSISRKIENIPRRPKQ